MLKQKIIEILAETLIDESDKQEHQELFNYIADRIVELVMPTVAEAVARAIQAYINNK